MYINRGDNIAIKTIYKLFYNSYDLISKTKYIYKLQQSVDIKNSYHCHFHFYCSLIFTFLGHNYLHNKQYEAAVKAYDKAIFQDHENIYALYGQYLANKKLGVQLENPTSMKCNSTKLFQYSDAYLENLITQFGYYMLAEKHNKKFYQNDQLIKAYNDMKHGNLVTAIDYFNKSLKLHPDNMMFILDLSYCYLKLHKYKKVLELLEKFTTGKALLFKGVARFYSKNYDESAKNLKQAGEIATYEHDQYHRTASQECYKLAYYYYIKNDLDLSITAFNKALDLNDKNIEALFMRAYLSKKRHNYIGAIADYHRILSMPDNKFSTLALDRLKNIEKLLSF